MTSVRVLVIGPEREGEGGMSVVGGHVARALAEHSVTRVPSRGGGGWVRDGLGFMRALVLVARRCLVRQPTIVHLNVAPRGSMFRKSCFAALAVATRRPFIVHFHSGRFGEWLGQRSALEQRGVRAVMKRATRIWVLADRFAAELSAQLSLPPDLFLVVANGVEAPTVERRPIEPPRILFVGRFVALKGIDVLLEAIGRRPLEGLDWRLELIGGGPQDVQTHVERLGLSSRVEIRPWVDRVKVDRALAEAAVLVVPSRSEGLPLVVLEAMAMGTPVVATRVGAVEDVLQNGELGDLVPPDDPERLAASIAGVLTHRCAAEERARRAREVWGQVWSAESFAQRVRDAYAPIIASVQREVGS